MIIESEQDRIDMILALGMGYRARTAAGEVDVIFENGYVAMDAPSGFRQTDTTPSLTVTSRQAADLGLDMRGTPVTVIDPCGVRTDYAVRDPQPDGTGMSRIELEKLQ